MNIEIAELSRVYLDWCDYNLYIEEGDEILGCASHRRKSLATNQDADFFIWLDSDIFFKDTTLAAIANAYAAQRNVGYDKFIITPQTVKLWNTGWDILVNEKFANKPLNYQNDSDIFVDVLQTDGTLNIKETTTTKFGCGLFSLLTTKLLNMIGIPASLGHYGHEDTFICYCCHILQANGYGLKQFVVENLIVGEVYKHKSNSTIVEHIATINRKEEFKNVAKMNFEKELQRFRDRHSL